MRCRSAFARASLRARTTAPLTCAACGRSSYLANRGHEHGGDSGAAEAVASAGRPVMTVAETATAHHDRAHCSRGGGHEYRRPRRTYRLDRDAGTEIFWRTK